MGGLGRAILEMRGREMGSVVGQRARGDRVLVVAKVCGMAAQPTVVMIVEVVSLMPMRLALESFVQIDLRLEVVMGAAIEKAMILPMVLVVVHAVGIVGRRVGAGRPVRRGSVGVGLEEASAIANG